MAKLRLSDVLVTRHGVAALVAAGALGMASAPAMAQVPGLDFYIGAGIGQSNADISADEIGDIDFDKKDMGWKLFTGLRAASMFGAELTYIDFGKADGEISEVKYKGLGLFGMVYAPLPVPVLDLYAKAGLARVDADLQVDADSFSKKDTQFAYGLGVQFNFGSFALRGEWEKFKVKDSDANVNVKPSLLSVSFSKSFL